MWRRVLLRRAGGNLAIFGGGALVGATATLVYSSGWIQREAPQLHHRGTSSRLNLMPDLGLTRTRDVQPAKDTLSPTEAFGTDFVDVQKADTSELTEELEQRPSSREDKPLTRYAIADAAAKVAPSVVNVTVAIEESAWGSWGPRMLSQSSGTGFVIDSKGHILTNAHVVAQGRAGANIQVTLQDSRNFVGKVVAFDSLSDLAVVKIDTPEELPVAVLGKSSDLRAGEFIVAVGSPLTLKNSITAGIVSNVGRDSYEIGMGGFSAAPAFIQIDAAINVGNSGGPLVNLDGEVIGINTMKVESGDGISFAIPIDYARDVLTQFSTFGAVRRPYLGVKLFTVTPILLRELETRGRKFPSSIRESAADGRGGGCGVMVHEVLPQSPADRGGLRAGDVIVDIDQTPVKSVKVLIDILTKNLEQEVHIGVIRGRDGKSVVLRVKPEVMRTHH